MIDFNKFVKADSLVIKNSQVNVRELVDFLQIGELESFLKGNTFIKNLSLIGLNISDSDVEVLANLENLTSLVLESNGISDEGANALANGKLTKLTSLVLKSNKIYVSGARALANLKNLTSLTLEDNKIGIQGAKALANGNLTKLTSLVLSSNKIGDEGVVGLTNGNLTNLTSFCLKFDIIRAKGLKALSNFENLTSLSLEWGIISTEGARVLANLKNLTSLHLTGNGIKSQGVKALAEGNLKNLTSLHLRWNSFNYNDAEVLAEGNFKNLTSLVLESNEISNTDIEDFSNALKKGRLMQLTSLSLASNKIGNGGAEALSEALKKDRLTNLTFLDLTGNRIDNKGAKALREAKKNLTILGLRSDAKAVTVRTNSVSEPEASSSKSAAHPFVKRSKSDAGASHHEAEQQPTQSDQQQKPNAQLGLKGLTSVVAKCGKKFLSLVRKGASKRKYPSELEVSTISSDTSTMPSPSKRFKSGEEADNSSSYNIEQQRTQFDQQQKLDAANQQQEPSAQVISGQTNPNSELSETQSMPHNQPHQRV